MQAFFDMELRHPHLPPEAFFRELIQPVQQLALDLVTRLGPRLDRKTADLWVESLMGLLLHARKGRAVAPLADEPVFYHGASQEEFVRHIVTFAAGGIRACAKASVRQRQLRPASKRGRTAKQSTRTKR